MSRMRYAHAQGKSPSNAEGVGERARLDDRKAKSSLRIEQQCAGGQLVSVVDGYIPE